MPAHNLIEITSPFAGVTEISINRAEARNAFTLEMAMDMRSHLETIANDENCRVVLLRGEGKSFCSGLDIKANANRQAEDQSISRNVALQEVYSGLVLQIRRLPQPVICLLQGAAVGAGLGLALACDIRLGAPSLTCLVGAVKIGLSAGECGISYHLPRLMGAAKAFEIMLTGRAVGAEEAERIGLVSRIVEEANLNSVAQELAQQLLEISPYSLAYTKKIMWQNLDAANLEAAILLENQTQIIGLATEDFKEASQAFLAKRPAKFTGR